MKPFLGRLANDYSPAALGISSRSDESFMLH